MRTTIDIPAQILKELDEFAKRQKISRAAAIRRAITEFVEKRTKRKTNRAFGIWKSKNVDALAYEDNIRNEWER